MSELVKATITAEASVDLAVGEQVSITGAGTFGGLVKVGKKTTGTTFFGVVVEADASAGKSVLIAYAGQVLVKLGGNATVGSYAESNATAGTCENAEASDKAFGQFLASGVAGELVPMIIKELTV